MPDSNITASLAEDFRLITAKELAAMLDISIRTIWRMCSDGSIPAPFRAGRAVRWRLSDIQHWIRNRCPNCRHR